MLMGLSIYVVKTHNKQRKETLVQEKKSQREKMKGITF
jgi:hypothetical protein